MVRCNLEVTIKKLLEILVSSKDDVVQDINNVFEVVDEDYITFALILYLKKCVDKELDKLRCCVFSDIINSIYTSTGYTIDRSRVEERIGQPLVIDAKLHSRSFESSTSGSDFGLLFLIPTLDIDSSGVAIKSIYNGILVQAKRNAQKGRPPEQYRKLSESFSDFSAIREFFSLAFYEFRNNDGCFKLFDILFLPLNTLEGGNKEFMIKVNNILMRREDAKFQDAEKFFSSFLRCDLGTTDKSKIEEYLFGSGLPMFEIRVEFTDGGRGINEIVREKDKERQIVREEKRIRISLLHV